MSDEKTGTNEARVKVGDRLIWRATDSRYSQDIEIEVTRLGRKWAYAKGYGYRELKFDAVTGFEDCGQYVSRHRALTAEQDADEKRRAVLVESLKAHGLAFGFSRGRDISTEQLARIVGVLDEGESG